MSCSHRAAQRILRGPDFLSVKLPKSGAAGGWGGDRLVSLEGPDVTWAIVWQTRWDSGGDAEQFAEAAEAAMADLPGAHAVVPADVSEGASDPVLVLMTSDPDTLASVSEALGVVVAVPG